MAETASRPAWGWRCVGHGCGAKEQAPGRMETEVARQAREHSRTTGHVVSWGILDGGRLK